MRPNLQRDLPVSFISCASSASITWERTASRRRPAFFCRSTRRRWKDGYGQKRWLLPRRRRSLPVVGDFRHMARSVFRIFYINCGAFSIVETPTLFMESLHSPPHRTGEQFRFSERSKVFARGDFHHSSLREIGSSERSVRKA